MHHQNKQTTIINYLIRELGLKSVVTYTFTGFLAMASHGRVSGRFRASKREQSVEITVTGNDKPPLELTVHVINFNDAADHEFLEQIQRDMNDASSFLDKVV